MTSSPTLLNPRRPLLALLGAGSVLALGGCGLGGTTTTVVQPPPTSESTPPPPTTTEATPPPTTDVPPTTTERSGPSAAERARTRRINALKRAAERETRKFFTAVRTRDTQGVCGRLTTRQVNALGGRSNCSNGRFIKESFVRQVPPSNGSLDFTIVLTTSNTRATVLVRHPERRYAVTLARQGGQWRVNQFRRFGG